MVSPTYTRTPSQSTNKRQDNHNGLPKEEIMAHIYAALDNSTKLKPEVKFRNAYPELNQAINDTKRRSEEYNRAIILENSINPEDNIRIKRHRGLRECAKLGNILANWIGTIIDPRKTGLYLEKPQEFMSYFDKLRDITAGQRNSLQRITGAKRRVQKIISTFIGKNQQQRQANQTIDGTRESLDDLVGLNLETIHRTLQSSQKSSGRGDEETRDPVAESERAKGELRACFSTFHTNRGNLEELSNLGRNQSDENAAATRAAFELLEDSFSRRRIQQNFGRLEYFIEDTSALRVLTGLYSTGISSFEYGKCNTICQHSQLLIRDINRLSEDIPNKLQLLNGSYQDVTKNAIQSFAGTAINEHLETKDEPYQHTDVKSAIRNQAAFCRSAEAYHKKLENLLVEKQSCKNEAKLRRLQEKLTTIENDIAIQIEKTHSKLEILLKKNNPRDVSIQKIYRDFDREKDRLIAKELETKTALSEKAIQSNIANKKRSHILEKEEEALEQLSPIRHDIALIIPITDKVFDAPKEDIPLENPNRNLALSGNNCRVLLSTNADIKITSKDDLIFFLESFKSTSKLSSDYYHMILSYPDNVHVNDEQAEWAIERHFIRLGLDLQQHGYAIFKHTDKSHQHYHAIITRKRADGRYHCLPKLANTIMNLECEAQNRMYGIDASVDAISAKKAINAIVAAENGTNCARIRGKMLQEEEIKVAGSEAIQRLVTSTIAPIELQYGGGIAKIQTISKTIEEQIDYLVKGIR